ncbi:MAG: MBL fold metallo-hydrolase [Fibrobacteraceae bacterium]|nr:MBL fold metallo-hydrolase [Fibrobacteraceae bacterium]
MGNGEAIVVDPGCQTRREKQELENFLRENQLNVRYCLNTHLHVDHIYGNELLKENFGALSVASIKDQIPREITERPIRRRYWPFADTEPKVDVYVNDGEQLKVGNHEILILETPGHSPGSLSFYIPALEAVFVGDLLEKSSRGTLQYIYSSAEQMEQSIKKILELPLKTAIYYGHGDFSSIKAERSDLGTD